MKKALSYIVYIILFYLIFTFILFPIANTLMITLKSEVGGLSLDSYRMFFSIQVNKTAFSNTVKVGIGTVLSCMVIGVYMAFYTDYFKAKYQRIVNLFMLSPFVLPGVMIVIAFIQLYSETGIVNQGLKLILNLESPPINFSGFWGIVFVHAFTQYIYFYINTSIALKFLDYSTIEAARGLGASKFEIFKDIIFPHIKPALLTSALMTFATGTGSFSAPYLIGGGYRMMSTQILQSKMSNQMQMASTQVILLMVISVTTMGLYSYYSKRNSKSKATKSKKFKKVKVESRIASAMLHVSALLIVTLIVVPLVAIILLSFADSKSWMMNIFPNDFGLMNYKAIFSRTRVLAPIKNSVYMSSIAAALATTIAVISSYLIIKDKSFKSRALNFLVLLPMAIPPSTLGVNLISAFNQKRLMLFNNSLVGTYAILPIAYVIATVTLVSRSTYTAFSNFNPEYEFASRNLGANQIKTFKWVILPIVSPGIISGFSLAFMRCVGEYTISALLYGVHNRPLSIAMVNALHDFDVGISMAYGGIVIFIGAIFLIVLSRYNDDFRI